MGQCTAGTVLDARFRVAEVSPAPVAQCIKGAVAKQAVKCPIVFHFVTGKISAVPILKKCMVILHVCPSHLAVMLLLNDYI